MNKKTNKSFFVQCKAIPHLGFRICVNGGCLHCLQRAKLSNGRQTLFPLFWYHSSVIIQTCYHQHDGHENTVQICGRNSFSTNKSPLNKCSQCSQLRHWTVTTKGAMGECVWLCARVLFCEAVMIVSNDSNELISFSFLYFLQEMIRLIKEPFQ